MIKRMGLIKAVEQCIRRQQPGWVPVSTRDFDPNRLLEFINDVEGFLDKEIHVRAEGSIFSIYCNDTALFGRMCKKLEYWITAVFEPANDDEYQFILDNGRKKVICNHLPFHTYQYRVYIKEKINEDTKDRLWTWMSKYDGKFRVPVRVATWLTGQKRWVTNPNIYVQDGPTLSMMLLFLGDRVSFVEEFVPRSMINIQSKETTCLV